MKKALISLLLIVQFLTLTAANYRVSDIAEYNEAVKKLVPGDSVFLSAGVWKDAQLVFYGEGTEAQPIVLTVEEQGKTTLEGQSTLQMHGNYLIVDGLVFVNGCAPGGEVIEFRKGDSLVANYSILRNCVVDRYNKADRSTQDAWVNLWGKYNTVEYCYFGGKTNHGVTLIVWPNGEKHNRNYHKIYRNYFAKRPNLGSNGGETIRIGTSHVCEQNSNTIVEGNYFEHCNGEVEIISVKSCENRIIDNTFFECEGSVVLRHGNRNEVSGNYFIGNMKPHTGGIRVINERHRIFNNYFWGLRGKDFRGPLVIMNGVPNSPAHRYLPVKDVEVSFNTWVDCEVPWQLGVGCDVERSVAPEDVNICNNLVYCLQEPLLIKAFDKLNRIRFSNNLLYSEKGNEVGEGFIQGVARLGRGSGGRLLALTKEIAKTDIAYVTTDIDGRNRSEEKWIGAFEMNDNTVTKMLASKANCGPKWYIPEPEKMIKDKVIRVAPERDALIKAIRKSEVGNVLELQEGEYINSKKIVIPHTLTIRAAEGVNTKPVIRVDMESGTTVIVFEIGSGLKFNLDGIAVDGGLKQKTPAKYAFATQKESSDSYSVFINNCEIYDFKDNNGGCIYKAYKHSFADTIKVTNTMFRDSYRGFALNEEKDNKGLYSAEYMIFDNTVFRNIEQWVLDFLRGGNDESTLGGNLSINHCVFDNANSKENQTIIRQTGLITISIENSIFYNSLAKQPIKLIGPYNSISHSCVYNSGKISASEGAKIGEGMIYSNPKFIKNTIYRLDTNSPLIGKANDNSNICLRD